MVKRILVGIDGSGPSRAALRWALHYAGTTEAELVLEHVVDDEWGQLGAEYARDETAEGERILEQAVASAAAGSTVRSVLRHGSPAWTLIADSTTCDLLVVGTHKTGFLRGRVLGTRSVVVASAAQCSVVVVPEDNSKHRRGVVVGVAPGDQSHAAIIVGAREAQRRHEELFLIHATTERGAPEIGRELLAHAASLAATVAPELTTHRRLAHRRRSDVLLDASRTASLLVIGESRTDGDRAGFLGTVTHEVILNLNSPVMIAR